MFLVITQSVRMWLCRRRRSIADDRRVFCKASRFVTLRALADQRLRGLNKRSLHTLNIFISKNIYEGREAYVTTAEGRLLGHNGVALVGR